MNKETNDFTLKRWNRQIHGKGREGLVSIERRVDVAIQELGKYILKKGKLITADSNSYHENNLKGMVSLFNCISTFIGNLMRKLFL